MEGRNSTNRKLQETPTLALPPSGLSLGSTELAEVRVEDRSTGGGDEAAVVARKALSGLSGRRYWRTLEELSGSPEFEEAMHREFPEAASEWSDPVSRRNFMKLMAASLALAGVTTGCSKRPEEKIVPYVIPPEQAVPGRPVFYATAVPFGGYGIGALVESHMGRPTKIEGNPDHPASLGASSAIMQAAILEMWDPDRAQTAMRAGAVNTWSAFYNMMWNEGDDKSLAAKKKNGGEGLYLLTETITSPTLLDQIQRLLKMYPKAKWHRYEAVNNDNARAGARMAFGKEVAAVYRFDRAERILSLDADFLLNDAGSLRYARDFADKRRVRSQVDREGRASGFSAVAMNRLYVIESTPSITGAMADERLRVTPSQIETLARAMAAEVGVAGAAAGNLSEAEKKWVGAAAADLKSAASVVVVGRNMPPAVHALGFAINEKLGAVGKTVVYVEPIDGGGEDSATSIAKLAEAMKLGSVDTLVILGGNPVYNAPADLDFGSLLKQVRLRIHHSLYYDETSYECDWHIPQAHFLETWSDIRAYDGTVTIQQPLIAPLYQSRSQHQMMSALLGNDEVGGMDAVRNYWRGKFGNEVEAKWNASLEKGIVEGSAAAGVQVNVRAGFLGEEHGLVARATGEGALEVIFRPDPSIWDGRYANNGWLQEAPKPLTKLTWDNAALMSEAMGKGLGLHSGDVVRLSRGNVGVELPVWIMPGHPDRCVTVYLGYGRTRAGRVGSGAESGGGGWNLYPLRKSDAMWVARDLQLSTTGKKYSLACTQENQVIETKTTEELVRVVPFGEFAHAKEHGEQGEGGRKSIELSLYPNFDYTNGHRWAMTIDTSACIGCNACVVACQAENNIPVVGKDQVEIHREMHWIRIDTYYGGKGAIDPRTVFEPIPCMHCETAPCEVVCPVAATTHSAEGLNEMTYNRCVGTRYCSNNCPYKVRRFNFFQYSKPNEPTYLLGKNPDVTVRERGVMEKCTYCVQRINGARIELKKLEVRKDRTGEKQEQDAIDRQMDAVMRGLETACQQSCPTEAIIFGDLNSKFMVERSEVSRLQAQPRDFGLLEELNTKPRTKYLPRVINPNPKMHGGKEHVALLKSSDETPSLAPPRSTGGGGISTGKGHE